MASDVVLIASASQWPSNIALRRIPIFSDIFHQEKLWKLVYKKELLDDIEKHEEASVFWKIQNDLEVYREDDLLVGHDVLDETPSYHIARTVESKNTLLSVLQTLHNTFQARVSTAKTREPGDWLSYGSEREVDEARVETTREKISAEWIGTLEKRYDNVNFSESDINYVQFASNVRQTYKVVRKTKLDIGIQVNMEFRTVHTQTDTYEIALEFQSQKDTGVDTEQIQRCDFDEISTTTAPAQQSVQHFDLSLNYHKSFINMENRLKKISCVAWHPIKPDYVAVAYISPLRELQHDESKIAEKPHFKGSLVQKSRTIVNESDIETIDSIFDIISGTQKHPQEYSADDDSASETGSAKDDSEDEENDESSKDVRDKLTSVIYKDLPSTCAASPDTKVEDKIDEHSVADFKWARDILKNDQDPDKSCAQEDSKDDSSDDAASISSLESESSCSTMKSEQQVKIPIYDDTGNEDADSIEDDIPIMDTDSSVLLWNCGNDLSPQLNLYNVHDVYVIKFYPMDGNFLAGGSKSGQLVIWDIREEIEKSKDRNKEFEWQDSTTDFMEAFPHWSSEEAKCPLVHPAATSARNISHVDRVTDVEWMHPSFKVCVNGTVTKAEFDSKQILSGSLDGSIKIWEMHSSHAPEAYQAEVRSWNLTLIYNITVTNPKLDKYPLSILTFKLLLPPAQYVSTSSKNYLFVPEANKKINLAVAVANTIGEVGIIKFIEKKDVFADTAASKAPENCKHEWWGICHDDSITSLSQNYFFPSIFLSTGGRIFALWNANFKNGPIWWKHYPKHTILTGSSFSPYHPGLIYISTSDGKVDLWNITKQIHQPLLEIRASGFQIEAISIVTPPCLEYQLSIADSNGIFHILGNRYDVTWDEDDYKNVEIFFKRAEECKKQLLHWNKHWKDLSTSTDEHGFQYKPEMKKPTKYDPQRRRSQRQSEYSVTVEKLTESTTDKQPLIDKITHSQRHQQLLQKLLEDYKDLPRINPSSELSQPPEPLSVNATYRIYCKQDHLAE